MHHLNLQTEVKEDLQMPISPLEPGFKTVLQCHFKFSKRGFGYIKAGIFYLWICPCLSLHPSSQKFKIYGRLYSNFAFILLWSLSLHCTNLLFPSYDSKWCNWNTYQQINHYLVTLKAYKIGMFCVFLNQNIQSVQLTVYLKHDKVSKAAKNPFQFHTLWYVDIGAAVFLLSYRLYY